MGYKKRSHPSLRLIAVMIATVSVLMGACSRGVFVNYATLGYGDVIPVEGWRLLGPITAMNGALMFGWSTAVIYEVLQKTMMISFFTAVPE
jgi:Ion channel